MNKEEIFELSHSGATSLQEELKRLKTEDRNNILEAIKEAREQGDLSENADYSSAREQQANIEARILEIENILKHAKIITAKKVTIKYIDYNEEATFEIVGTIEADPLNDKISNDSPLGKEILFHKVGDIFHVVTESGKDLRVELLEMV